MPAQSAAQQVDMAPPAFLSLRPVLFVIAGLFSATFTAAGTAVLIYSLDIKRPIPPQIIFGFVAVFILIFTLLSITLLVHHALTVRKAKKEHACLHTQLHTHDVVELEDAPTQVQNPVSNDEGALTQMRNPVLNDGFERQKLNQPERPRKIHIAELDTAKREVYRRNGVHEEPYPPTPTPELRGGPYQVGAKSTGITQVNGERHNKLQSQKQKNPQSLRIQVPAPKVMHRIIESSPLPVSMIPTESELEEHRIREQRKKEERQSQNSNAEVAHQLPKLTSFPSPLFNNVDWGNQSDSGTASPLISMSPISPLTTAYDSSFSIDYRPGSSDPEIERLLPSNSSIHTTHKFPDRATYRADRARITGFIEKFKRERATYNTGR